MSAGARVRSKRRWSASERKRRCPPLVLLLLALALLGGGGALVLLLAFLRLPDRRRRGLWGAVSQQDVVKVIDLACHVRTDVRHHRDPVAAGDQALELGLACREAGAA